MKTAALAQKFTSLLPKLRCPICGSPFSPTDQSLVCERGHCFDLSRRGYVNFAPSHNQSLEKYDAHLFENRARVFADGFYQPVADAVCDMLQRRFAARPFTLLDIGCGEGYYAGVISERFPNATVAGLDLSRDAVSAAARDGGRVHWLVADLKRMPFANGAADVILDVLTPANYEEFRRVLSRDGELIKVIPDTDYLRQVRLAVAKHLRNGGVYDNTLVLSHLGEHTRTMEEAAVDETRPLSPEQSYAFLRMTPMTFSVPEEVLRGLSLEEITIQMRILRCHMT